jgi:hypothetical protein
MSESVIEGSSTYETSLDVTAHPQRITAGGIVLLVARPPEAGTYDAEWTVEGPVRLSQPDTRVALLGATTVTGRRVTLTADDEIRATLDTSPLTVGAWTVRVRLTKVEAEDDSQTGRMIGYEGRSDPIDVVARPFSAGDGVAVTLKRSEVRPTRDQALWVAIRNSTNALGFDNFSRFMDLVVCGERSGRGAGRLGRRDIGQTLREVNRRVNVPFPNVEGYRLLKAATEVFLMIHCGVDIADFRRLDLDEESRRLNRTVQPGDIEAQFRDYLVSVPAGGGRDLDVLPYLGLIRLKLRDVAVVGFGEDDGSAQICYGILADKLANPCFLEPLWSYWNDEGGLMQTVNAISWRFQNRLTAPPGRDPLAGLDIDPLRPLNNLLWGWIQDTPHRLTTVRRAYEYDHQYGLALASMPGPPVRGADSRSRFIEAFHNLLATCSTFYKEDDDTTVIADGFGVLNALKETHLLLTQGSHNEYGDLPWTARHEMLMTQWVLAQPEMRDFLPTRTMVAYPEPWMDRVEAMNKLQGRSDASVLHFRDLAVFGEQLLLGIRFGAWTTVIEPEFAANWARYWRSEVQGYTHAYRAVTGVNLTERTDTSTPALHLRRRQALELTERAETSAPGFHPRQRHRTYRG